MNIYDFNEEITTIENYNSVLDQVKKSPEISFEMWPGQGFQFKGRELASPMFQTLEESLGFIIGYNTAMAR